MKTENETNSMKSQKKNTKQTKLYKYDQISSKSLKPVVQKNMISINVLILHIKSYVN